MIKYYSNGNSNPLSRSYDILDENENIIGSSEGYCNEYGDVVLVVKIYPEHQKQGLGFAAFKKVFDELNSIVPIKRIIGSWHRGGEFESFENGMSTNMKIYQECIANNATREECAFLTPTGKWARRVGFNQCEVVQNSTDEIVIHFFPQLHTSAK